MVLKTGTISYRGQCQRSSQRASLTLCQAGTNVIDLCEIETSRLLRYATRRNVLKTLVTGVAGFIGYHVATYLLARGDQVIGIDNINDYYDTSLKEARLQQLEAMPQAGNFKFLKLDIAQDDELATFFETERVDAIVHLAAQAGVRYSIENPHAYIQANIRGFLNILVGAQKVKVKHLVYASSSSVYGNSKTVPFSTQDQVDHPVSMYAATKKSNEALLQQQQQQAQINANAARVASAMSAQQQNSNANSAEALQAIFFLLQIGLTLYTLGAFAPGHVPATGYHPQPDPAFFNW